MASSAQVKRILVFGTTGAGKSTLVNNIAPEANLKTSNCARGVTLESTLVRRRYNNNNYHIIDTAGLNEDESGSVPPEKAITNLLKLLKSTEEGLNLMIMVTKGRIVKTTTSNYQFFVDTVTSNKVPVIIVQTHLDNEEDLTQWDADNKEYFTAAGLKTKTNVGTTFPRFNPKREATSAWADATCKESTGRVWAAIEKYASLTPVKYFDNAGFFATFRRIWNAMAKMLSPRLVWVTNHTLSIIQNMMGCNRNEAKTTAQNFEMSN